MDFAAALKQAMGKETISDLSRRSGVPISTISRHLHGEHEPTLGALDLYEKALPRLKRLRAAPSAAPAKGATRAGSAPRTRSAR